MPFHQPIYKNKQTNKQKNKNKNNKKTTTKNSCRMFEGEKNIHPCKQNGIRTKIFLFFINPTVVHTSESWILCYLEPDFFLTQNERLSVSFRSLNVWKLEMVAGKDAELALVLVVVAALLITLLIVPTCDI